MKHGACLVLNAGSSSLKFSVFRHAAKTCGLQPVLTGQISGIGGKARFEAKDTDRRVLADTQWDDCNSSGRDSLLRYLLRWLDNRLVDEKIVAAGHRVVHGGRQFNRPLMLSPDLIDQLETLVPLAPLHQPHNLAPIRMLAEINPNLAQVACFDTAFHNTQPWLARTYALPQELTAEGVCRYGFHGLSYEYVTRQLLDQRPELAKGRIAICHLGNGSSICAVKEGKSVDTSMGFTALDGVPMGTRPGGIDPGVLLYLMREKGMDLEAIEDLLYRRSGLLGVSGLSNDMRVLLESDVPQAQQAVELFCFRVAKEVAALAASMEGLDALVFTAGIGENSPAIRERIVRRLEWLGPRIDARANAVRAFDISAADAGIPVFVVPTNEELMIAEHTLAVVPQIAGHA